MHHHRGSVARLAASSRSCFCVACLFVALLFLWCPPLLSAGQAAGPASGTVHALLINGGDRPATNYLSHLHHLEEMVDLLRKRGVAPARIHIFSADGQEDAADLATRDVPPTDFWLIEGTSLGDRLKPSTEFSDTRWAGVTLHPARLGALREWFEAARQTIAPGDRLLVFVTDHGTTDRTEPGNSAVSLWHEKLTVRELKALLALLSPGVDVVMVMSQCYSGGFAQLMYDSVAAEPSGGVCGFFSTTADRRAYGCYPEGRDRDKTGHAFQFIDALGRRATTAEAHLDVLVDDDTPDVPLRTSDLYLARLTSEGAAARGMAADAFADSLLDQAWREPALWDREVGLLFDMGNAFGLADPRSLGEIASHDKALEALSRQMKASAERWRIGLLDVKEFLLQAFSSARPDWRVALEPQRTRGLNTQQRAELLEKLLVDLSRFAGERPDILGSLTLFHDRHVRGSEAARRIDVRRAALQRVRTILMGVAGRTLLAQRDRERHTQDGAPHDQALQRLESCEALAPGHLPAAPVAERRNARPPFPPVSTEIERLKEILPSWLGVRSSPVPESMRRGRTVPAGARVVEVVFSGSAAAEAGLKAGDFITGLPERWFDSPHQLREWTLTAPRDTPLTLLVLRPGNGGDTDQEFEVTIVLRPYPNERDL